MGLFKKIGKGLKKALGGAVKFASAFFGMGGTVTGSSQGLTVYAPKELTDRIKALEQFKTRSPVQFQTEQQRGMRQLLSIVGIFMAVLVLVMVFTKIFR